MYFKIKGVSMFRRMTSRHQNKNKQNEIWKVCIRMLLIQRKAQFHIYNNPNERRITCAIFSHITL